MIQSFYMVQRRELRTHIEQDGSIWFVAKDACEILDIPWRGNETLNMLEDDEKGVRNFRTPSEAEDGRGGGEQELIIINEPGMYRLAFRSNKPEARAFTRWVTHEVLPSIRRTGSYGVKNNGKILHIDLIEQIRKALMQGDMKRMSVELQLSYHTIQEYLGMRVKKPNVEKLQKMQQWVYEHRPETPSLFN